MGNQGPTSDVFLHVEVEGAGAISDTGEKPREWGVLEDKKRNASRKKNVICAHTTLFKMNNQQGPCVEKMEFCSMFCGSLDGKQFEDGYRYVHG